MTEYERENLPPCGIAGCEEAGIAWWNDGLHRCREHDAVLQASLEKQVEIQHRRAWLEGKLYAALVLEANKPFGKRGLTDEDLRHYRDMAKRYASFLEGA